MGYPIRRPRTSPLPLAPSIRLGRWYFSRWWSRKVEAHIVATPSEGLNRTGLRMNNGNRAYLCLRRSHRPYPNHVSVDGPVPAGLSWATPLAPSHRSGVRQVLVDEHLNVNRTISCADAVSRDADSVSLCEERQGRTYPKGYRDQASRLERTGVSVCFRLPGDAGHRGSRRRRCATQGHTENQQCSDDQKHRYSQSYLASLHHYLLSTMANWATMMHNTRIKR